MKKRDVRRIVEKHLDALKARLGLDSWAIDVKYGKVKIPGREGDRFGGKCILDPAYFESATIVINPKMHDKPAEVIETLQHELVHCLVACFLQLLHVSEEFCTTEQFRALEVIYYHASEELVEKVCRILGK